MFSFHGYSSRVIKAKRATGEYTQRIPLWRAETRDNGPRAAALDEAAQRRVGRGCCMGCPKTISPARKPGCLHTQCSCTYSCTRQAPRAGWTGTRSQQCHPGQGPQQHGDACSPQVPRLERNQEEKLLRSLLHFTCCEQRHLLNTQSAKAAEPPFTVTTGEKQNSNRNPQKNTSGKSEQAGHLHGDRGRCGFPPEQSSAERHN